MLELILDNANRRFPTKIALICEEKSYTYGELRELTLLLAASLLERGIRPGDRVAFLLSNQLPIVLCYYACFQIGAIAVPLNIRFESELLKYAIAHSGARVLITEAELFARIEPIRSFLEDVEQFYLISGASKFRKFDHSMSYSSRLLALNFFQRIQSTVLQRSITPQEQQGCQKR